VALLRNGVRYRVTPKAYEGGRLYLEGPRLVGEWLPDGVTLDSPNLRRHVEEAVADHQRRRRAASEMIQQRVRDGKI
jgi:hypothetical protein